MIINYNDSTRDAGILARAGDTMRIALQDCEDAVELNFVDGQWMSEEKIPISFEFLIASEIRVVFSEYGNCLPMAAEASLSGYGIRNALAC